MTGTPSSQYASGSHAVARRAAELLYTFILSAAAAIAPMIAAAYETFNWVRLGALLTTLILLHALVCPWLRFTRELVLYAVLFAYMSISIIWAPSFDDGLNTVVPAADFLLIMILFGSLVEFHDLGAVFRGVLAGFLGGAAIYTRVVGFPFVFPEDFSYNAIAGMYLFGLLSTLFYAWYTRAKLLPLFISLIIMMHIAATTSIKTNLGIVLGAAAAALLYLGSVARVLWRNAILLGILTVALVYAVLSNNALLERVVTGLDRVSHGVEILQRREDTSQTTSFSERADWQSQGIKGWLRSPVFGNGVEAFRTDHGITSHSTPIDLLYNFGLIGFSLFYAIFGSITLRLMFMRTRNLGSLPALILAGIVCYVFITLSGTMHYNMFMAIFISVSVGLLRRLGGRANWIRGASVPNPS